MGFEVNSTATPGSVAWWMSGHVAWVATVDDEGIAIEEYNFSYGRYSERRLNPSHTGYYADGWPDAFIHFKDLDQKNYRTSAISVAVIATVEDRACGTLVVPPIEPYIFENRTFLPLRYLIETILEGEVVFDANTRVITATLAEHSVVVDMDNPEPSMVVDGIIYKNELAPVNVEGYLLVPLRALERLVSDITWDPETKTVAIIPYR